ncbi:Ribosome biogenesis protein BMS1-like, partial [Melia azedarach]
KKKGLRDREKLFYAPMYGLGDLLYDKGAVYININDHFVQFSKVDDESGKTTLKGKGEDVGETLVKSLQNTKYAVDEKLEKSFISLFSRKPNPSVVPNNAKDTDEDAEDIQDKEYQTGEETNADGLGEKFVAKDLDNSQSSDGDGDAEKAIFGNAVDRGDLKDSDEEHEDDDEDEDDDDNDVDNQSLSGSDFSEEGDDEKIDDGLGNISKWKESLLERTVSRQSMNLMQLVYGKLTSTSAISSKEVQDSSEDEESDDNEFFKPKGEGNKKLREGLDSGNVDTDDCSKFKNYEDLKSWKQEEVYESIRDRFVTGDWSKLLKEIKLLMLTLKMTVMMPSMVTLKI